MYSNFWIWMCDLDMDLAFEFESVFDFGWNDLWLAEK